MIRLLLNTKNEGRTQVLTARADKKTHNVELQRDMTYREVAQRLRDLATWIERQIP